VFDRTAKVNMNAAARIGLRDIKLLQKIPKAQIVRGFVDDQTHRSFIGMGAHEYYSPFKTGISHARHRDKKLAI
jgi:hypothetical protein